ncbi:MAG: bifunctional DNA-formamidopyrimidine glycosylase/DNA-(apurinic or apyrimidinic site) lyase [Phycisphaerales bacterium]|nr:bifunctional DNA-formamidopyrimidine glycosylase/DNA-(apurinic or apyrimidinic site) lyase [Phycisphaerales bacterium]
MPEAPEVERVRRTLEPWLVGATVLAATLRRRDIVVRPGDPPGGLSRQRAGTREAIRLRPVPRHELLVGQRIARVERHGKQLAIATDAGPALVVHLGMTGRLLVDADASDGSGQRSSGTRVAATPHTHITWRLARDAAPIRLRFIDPRRFGGVWIIPTRDDLQRRRTELGPDATAITGAQLSRALASSARPIKAALLDQRTVAGVGNIYADESLFEAGITPRRLASTLTPADIDRLATAIRLVIARAIDAGGSTIRDYADADGQPGSAQTLHAVYGRAARPCLRCATALASGTVAQRTTVWCPRCQR